MFLQFFSTPSIDFIGKRKIYYAISTALVVITLGALAFRKGVNPGIDFVGGTLVQGFFQKPVGLADIRSALNNANMPNAELQSVPEHNAVIIRFKTEVHAKESLGTDITNALNKSFADNSFQVERVEFVGPAVGRHLILQGTWAFLGSLVGICVYVAFRFKKFIWGVTGIIALFHDVFLTLGFLAITHREFSITVLAALLTIAGYSINDTIVIYDRIRENLRARRKEPLDVLMNRSINETLSRTIITNSTVFIVLLALLFFGGEVIRDFTLAMVFGSVIGTYSTIFIASAMVFDWQKNRKTPLW